MAVVSCKTFNLINERAAAWSSEKIVFPFAIWLSALLLCELFARDPWIMDGERTAGARAELFQ